MPLEPFVPNRRYRRRTDLHGRYGGQTQGGISTPAGYPIILLFTGQTGEQYGYGQDGWDGDVFRYCGEGQRGDMEFRAGNKAIRDHVENGKALHLFKILGRGEVRHIGEFICAGWQEERGQDVDGNDRKLIVFSLAPAHAALDDIAPSDAAGIDELRARALAAPKLRDGDAATSSRRVYERSRDVRLYVLARAKGRCESCGAAAPFKRKRDGSPYLEPHHTKMIAEGGPDHPRWVAAVCPNCHSEIHFGEQGCEKNSALSAYLAQVES
jgi:5-methylcytosine-specific restriction protein A